MSIELLALIIAGALVIVFANAISQRIGVAGPLILVAIGVGISLIPAVSAVSVPPELILVGVLPPLLFSAAVSAPAIEFRRDLAAISGLSVLLVIVSSLVLGLFLFWAIPGLGFPLAVALGAILSPTDAVATTIVRKLGVPQRVVTVLEGEALLNDATALVLLRTAIVAAAAGFSFLTTLGDFVWAVLWAVVVGLGVGWIALRLRALTTSATANTALGLTIPYLAFLPTEVLGGSGLVAAVVAGVVCGQGSLRWLTPEQRISDKLNWRTISFLLEGAVFLVMGLQLWGIVENNLAVEEGLLEGIGIAAGALVILLAVRAAYVFPMLRLHTFRMRRAEQNRLSASEEGRRPDRGRARRIRADIDYFDSSPLTWKHDMIVVWAGMRGAVTLAAAQTLPPEIPQRDLLVFIAFLVAAGSLIIQGLTLPALAQILGLRQPGGSALPHTEIREINEGLQGAAQAAIDGGELRHSSGRPFSAEIYALPAPRFIDPLDPTEGADAPESFEFQLALVAAMRSRLHELGRSGRYSTIALRFVLDELDAYEIDVKLHLESER